MGEWICPYCGARVKDFGALNGHLHQAHPELRFEGMQKAIEGRLQRELAEEFDRGFEFTVLCGNCGKISPPHHACCGRWEDDGALTSYCMPCEGAAAAAGDRTCGTCGHHRRVCWECYPTTEADARARGIYQEWSRAIGTKGDGA